MKSSDLYVGMGVRYKSQYGAYLYGRIVEIGTEAPIRHKVLRVTGKKDPQDPNETIYIEDRSNNGKLIVDTVTSNAIKSEVSPASTRKRPVRRNLKREQELSKELLAPVKEQEQSVALGSAVAEHLADDLLDRAKQGIEMLQSLDTTPTQFRSATLSTRNPVELGMRTIAQYKEEDIAEVWDILGQPADVLDFFISNSRNQNGVRITMPSINIRIDYFLKVLEPLVRREMFSILTTSDDDDYTRPSN